MRLNKGDIDIVLNINGETSLNTKKGKEALEKLAETLEVDVKELRKLINKVGFNSAVAELSANVPGLRVDIPLDFTERKRMIEYIKKYGRRFGINTDVSVNSSDKELKEKAESISNKIKQENKIFEDKYDLKILIGKIRANKLKCDLSYKELDKLSEKEMKIALKLARNKKDVTKANIADLMKLYEEESKKHKEKQLNLNKERKAQFEALTGVEISNKPEDELFKLIFNIGEELKALKLRTEFYDYLGLTYKYNHELLKKDIKSNFSNLLDKLNKLGVESGGITDDGLDKLKGHWKRKHSANRANNREKINQEFSESLQVMRYTHVDMTISKMVNFNNYRKQLFKGVLSCATESTWHTNNYLNTLANFYGCGSVELDNTDPNEVYDLMESLVNNLAIDGRNLGTVHSGMYIPDSRHIEMTKQGIRLVKSMIRTRMKEEAQYKLNKITDNFSYLASDICHDALYLFTSKEGNCIETPIKSISDLELCMNKTNIKYSDILNWFTDTTDTLNKQLAYIISMNIYTDVIYHNTDIDNVLME